MFKKSLLTLLDNFESYICQILLTFFVVILFLQISLRVCFNYVIPWSEEISRFAFVWFVFFGAAYAARLAAHNRVMLQFKLFPKSGRRHCHDPNGFNLDRLQPRYDCKER